METQTTSVVTAAAEGAPRGGVSARRTRVVLPRRARDVPRLRTARRAAVAPRVRVAACGAEWSPFPDWSAAVAWLDATTAAVWLWNPEALPVARVRSWLPESLLLASDARPIEVNRSLGRLDRPALGEGRLSAELYYSAMPSAAEWSSTMATLGVSDADSQAGWRLLAAAQPGAPLPKPWPERVERLDARHRCAPSTCAG